MDGGLDLLRLVAEGENVVVELVVVEGLEPALRT
jgi:hypothetical protein